MLTIFILKNSHNTNLHDKVEFEILLFCYTPLTEKKLKN